MLQLSSTLLLSGHRYSYTGINRIENGDAETQIYNHNHWCMNLYFILSYRTHSGPSFLHTRSPGCKCRYWGIKRWKKRLREKCQLKYKIIIYVYMYTLPHFVERTWIVRKICERKRRKCWTFIAFSSLCKSKTMQKVPFS